MNNELSCDDLTVETSIINRVQMFFSLISVLFAAALIIAFIGIKSKHTIIAGLLFMICLTIPFILKKEIKNFFMKRIVLNFNSTCFSTNIFSRRNNPKVKYNEYKWDDLKSYQITILRNGLTTLKIKLKEPILIKLTFDEKNFEEGDRNRVTEAFNRFIFLFNKSVNRPDRIIITPPFFATKTGTYFIYCLTVLLIVAVFLHLFFHPRSSPFTFMMATGLILQSIIQRKADIKMHNKIVDRFSVND